MQKPQKLILKNFLSPGDIVMLTAAVRDLHRCYPNQFITDVRTSCPALWEHNPYLTPINECDPEARTIDCHYPLVHESNQRPYHFIHGFIEYLNGKLDLRIKPTEFKGDIHLSEEEKSRPSQVAEAFGNDRPFWIIVAGGKYDYTIKWWSRRRYQEVVDHFRDQILFVQVGEKGHYHPPLRNVHDLRKKTSLRDLVRLVYHADGILCPVTLLMHLAAAVPLRPEKRVARACVVIAGGREPSHWEAYPNHQFLHTVGSLPCCAHGGCWRSRTLPLGDGEYHDEPDRLCLDVVNRMPKCMELIGVAAVTHVMQELYPLDKQPHMI
jgi:ADP-heptose:LPS heptosyltransferase